MINSLTRLEKLTFSKNSAIWCRPSTWLFLLAKKPLLLPCSAQSHTKHGTKSEIPLHVWERIILGDTEHDLYQLYCLDMSPAQSIDVYGLFSNLSLNLNYVFAHTVKSHIPSPVSHGYLTEPSLRNENPLRKHQPTILEHYSSKGMINQRQQYNYKSEWDDMNKPLREYKMKFQVT